MRLGEGVDPAPILNFSLNEILKLEWGNYYLGAISLWSVVVPSPKIVINLPWIYEKLQSKGEPYRLSGDGNPDTFIYR